MMSRVFRAVFALSLATAIWLPSVHLFFPGADGDRREALADALTKRQMTLWASDTARRDAVDPMRGTNPEWDFMGRTFLVLALTNRAIADPVNRAAYLDVVDRIIDDTLRLERTRGQRYFLMAYANRAPFVHPSGRSLFVDGEIALMLASRQLVRSDPKWDGALERRIQQIVRQMEDNELGIAESYPDEAWTFCNTAALAAIRIADHVRGTNHDELLAAWVDMARTHLVDPDTGLLVSSFTTTSKTLDGPEGSSLWTSAHFLRFVDDDFAQDQYRRARAALRVEVLGFGYAKEWPTAAATADVDSGPIVPVLEASAGSSGQALIAAAAFDDEDFLEALTASLDLAAFPIDDETGRRYSAATQVGDAVLLYALSYGPALRLVREGRRS